jgi:hypothetical protein
MSDWLNHPAVQSAVIPFVVAFVIAWLLRPHGGVLAGLGWAVACGIAVYFIAGFQWSPLTSTRKVIVAGAAALALGLVVEFVLRGRTARYWLLALFGAGTALWLIWPLALGKHGRELWLFAVPAAAYGAWLVAGLEGLNSRPVNLVVASLALAAATAFAALLGASALLGQLGGAVAAAVGAYAVVFLASGEFQPRSPFSAPVAAASALIGLAAVVYAKLPWTALVALAAIPALAQLPVPRGWGVLPRGLLAALYTFPAAAVAIALTWRVTGPPPF